MADWVYEWHPWPGSDARMIGPTSWGWLWELRVDGRLIDEGEAPTRLGALDALAMHGRNPADDVIVAGLRLPPVTVLCSGT